MTPCNITSGFKVSGIYSYDPNAILKHFPVDQSQPPPSLAEESPKMPEFNEEQERLFERRFEDGYDVYEDPHYVL